MTTNDMIVVGVQHTTLPFRKQFPEDGIKGNPIKSAVQVLSRYQLSGKRIAIEWIGDVGGLFSIGKEYRKNSTLMRTVYGEEVSQLSNPIAFMEGVTRYVIRRGGIPVFVDSLEHLNQLMQAINTLDESNQGTNEKRIATLGMKRTIFMYRKAKAEGCTVLITGLIHAQQLRKTLGRSVRVVYAVPRKAMKVSKTAVDWQYMQKLSNTRRKQRIRRILLR